MNKEVAYEEFCKEHNITDVIQKELGYKPFFMYVWKLSRENFVEDIGKELSFQNHDGKKFSKRTIEKILKLGLLL